MTSLNVNEHHEAMLGQYLRFCRYQRGQRLRAIESCFEDVRNSQLQTDTTFTRDEIEEILTSLEAVVKGEAESEFINGAHTNVLLLKQMCHQAESWHLKLNADISDLENAELLAKIKSFEDHQNSLANKPQLKLESIQGGGAAPLLKAEIDRLAKQNQELSKNLSSVSQRATSLDTEKDVLNDALSQAQSKLSHAGVTELEVQKIKKEMDRLQKLLDQDVSLNKAARKEMEDKLRAAEKQYREVDEKHLQAQKELEKKVHQTAQYRNLMKILKQKSSQLKECRARLAKYEPDFIAADSGDLEVEDD